MEGIKATLLSIWQILVQERSGLSWDALNFGRYNEAVLVTFGLALVSILVLLFGYSRQKSPGRTFIVLPGIIPSFRSSPFSPLRHLPVLLFFAGFICFIIAFADPFLSFVRSEMTVRGQKIAILVDASGSMG